MPLIIHGLWQQQMEGQLLRLTLTGAFNSAGVEALHAEAATLLRECVGQGLRPPLAALVDLNQWQLTTPDSQWALQRMFERIAATGFTHVAYCGASRLRQHLLESCWQGVSGVSRHYANSIEDACRWLQEAGFSDAVIASD
ncbi:MAG: hypothetical protein II007_00150 [Gammaproteobacteria bacterium]|nr:hypothetical protein [Gammaproteobacteria bacterium]